MLSKVVLIFWDTWVGAPCSELTELALQGFPRITSQEYQKAYYNTG